MAGKEDNTTSKSDWDPMKEDYQDSSFNSYMSKSGVNLASQRGYRDNGVTLYVSGIPSNLSKEALRNMFSQAGNVISVSNLKNRDDTDNCYGFVRMDTVEAAERAIQKFHKFTLASGRNQLCVDIAHSTEYKNKNVPKVINESLILRPETDQVMKHSKLSSGSSSQELRCCTVCQKQASKQCQRCKIPYCSRECQQQDWPKHKKICPATRTVAKEVVHITQNSRPPVCSKDDEFEKRFEISIGEEFASVTAEAITKDKNLAEDVSKIIVYKEEDTKHIQSVNQQQVKNRTQEAGHVKCVDLDDNSEVILMSYINPSDFWVVPVTSLQNLAQLQETLNKFYMNTSPDESFLPAPGDLCAGQFSMDKNWYRCRIDCMLANTGEAAVSYVDYGNAEVIPVSCIRLLQSHFTDLPFQAVHCSLYGIKPTGGKWSVDAVRCASTLMPETKPLSVRVKEREETCIFVDVISASGHNVAERLLSEGLAQNITRKMQKNTNIQPNQSEHEVNSAGKIFSQDEENSMQQTLSKKEKLPQPVTSLQSELSSFKQSEAAPVITKVQDSLKVDDIITIKIQVTKSPSQFWAHVVSERNMKGLMLLTSKLNSYYSELETNRDFIPSPNELFACYCLADKQCNRAQLRRASKNTLDVFYVDYGKMDVVLNSLVHPLLPSHYALPLQALSCSLAGVRGTNPDGVWNQEAIDLFLKHTAETVAVKIISKDEKCCQVLVLLPDGSTLNDLLIKKELAFPLPGYTQLKQQEPGTDACIGVKVLPVLAAPVNDVLVNVAHAPNVNNIVVQLIREEDVAHLRAIHQVMDNFKPSVSSFQPKDGDLIAAKYSQDGKWYRTEVKKVLSALKFHVYFIDYGNEEEVSRTSVAPLPDSVFRYPALGVRCSLAGIKGADSWDPKLLENQLFKMTITDPADNEKLTVKLYNNETGCSINDQLVEIGFAVKDCEQRGTDSPVEAIKNREVAAPSSVSDSTHATQPSVVESEGSTCISDKASGRSTKCIMSADVPYQSVDSDQIPAVTVYYLNSAEFYIVWYNPEVLSCTNEMSLDLHTAYSNSTNMNDAGAKYEPVVGELVAAYCVSDQCWYRAEVLKTSMKEVEVLYTEYGNKETVSASQVRQLLPQFAKLPKQALKCSFKEELILSDEEVLHEAIQDKVLIYKLDDSGTIKDNFTVVDIMLPDDMTSLISQMTQYGAAVIKEHDTSPSLASSLENGTTHLKGEEVTNGQRPFTVEGDVGAWISPSDEENLDPKQLLKENMQLKKTIRELRQQLYEMKMKMKEDSSD